VGQRRSAKARYGSGSAVLLVLRSGLAGTVGSALVHAEESGKGYGGSRALARPYMPLRKDNPVFIGCGARVTVGHFALRHRGAKEERPCGASGKDVGDPTGELKGAGSGTRSAWSLRPP
jgi:hypothetical protein